VRRYLILVMGSRITVMTGGEEIFDIGNGEPYHSDEWW
jgi:hypothetical protein